MTEYKLLEQAEGVDVGDPADLTSAGFGVIIGTTGDSTHATFEAALADSNVGTNIKILVASSIAIAAVALTKAGWRIYGAPGVTLSKGASANGLMPQAANIWIRELRFAGFVVASDKAIVGNSSWDYGRVQDCAFAVGTDTEVDDSAVTAGKKPKVLGNFTEV